MSEERSARTSLRETSKPSTSAAINHDSSDDDNGDKNPTIAAP